MGWFVIFRQSNFLKIRDDVKTIVNDATNVIDMIFVLSVEYYEKNEKHIGFCSADIRSKFLLLSHYLILISQYGVKTNIESYVVAYRKAVMAGYFETENFKKQLEIPNMRAEISNCRSELNFRINKCYLDWSLSTNFFQVVFLRK